MITPPDRRRRSHVGVIVVVVLRALTRLPIGRQAARDAAAPRLVRALGAGAVGLDRRLLVHAHDQVAEQAFGDLQPAIELLHQLAADR